MQSNGRTYQRGFQNDEKRGDKDARDAGMICAAQKLEHYEIVYVYIGIETQNLRIIGGGRGEN
jgi:hypothetical protein